MRTLRTRFKKDIVCEFLPHKLSNRVIIFCDGAPSVPKKTELLEFWNKKGFWVFHPRYRGAWESDGKFLQHSLEKDVLDVIDELPRGFKALRSGTKYRIKPKKIFIVGSSFGGPAAILSSRDPRVDKIVAVSPVIDWTAPSKDEPFDFLIRYMAEGYGNGYRVAANGWNKLKSGKFYNPVNNIKELDPNKIFIIHAKDDRSVLYGPVKKFATKLGCKFKSFARGGHLSNTITTKPAVYRQVRKFMVE